MILMSVVVPVYDVEQYLRQCVDSILNQDFKDIEVILVDDGSKDKSGNICDWYQKKDPRIRVIHKENGGLSSARNAGIDIARGEYIVFIDSDDYFYRQDCLSKIAKEVECGETDIIIVPSIVFFEERNQYKYIDKQYSSKMLLGKKKCDALKYALRYDFFKACAWDKVVKRQLIEDNRIRFINGILSEDIDYTARLLLCAKTFDCIDEPVYVYRKRKGSITAKITYKHMMDVFDQIRTIAEWDSKEQMELLNGYLAHNYVMLMEMYNKVIDTRKLKRKNEIKEYSYLLNYDFSLNVSKVRKVYNLLGFDLTRMMLKIFRK